MKKLTLKPSLLVGCGIGRIGGLAYHRELLEERMQGDREIKHWDVTREIPNLTQYKKAEAIAAECRRLLLSVCVRMSFGLVCPKDRAKELDDIVELIRQKLAEANAELTICQLTSWFVRAEILTNDREAAEALVGQIGQFLTELTQSLEQCNVKAIRQTLLAMKGLDALVGPEESKALQDAVKMAKKVARQIVVEVEKKGREIAAVKQELDLSAIDVARVTFLEIEDEVEIPVGVEGGVAARLEEVEV